jgi:AraC-like DNA-binding protein
MKEYIYNTITHPVDFYREMSQLSQSVVTPEHERSEANVVVRELIDLGDDSWAIYSSMRFSESIKLTMKTNYDKNWMRLLFIKFHENDVILDAEISKANNYSFLPKEQIGFETYKSETWIQKDGNVRMLKVFLNEEFLKKELWHIDLNTIKNRELRIKVNGIQPQIMDVIRVLGIDRLDNHQNRFMDLDKSKQKELVLKLIRDCLWVIFPNQNAQITEKARQEIIGIREAEKHLMSDFSSDVPSLDELAKIAGINRAKFQKLFKDIYGDSFYTYYQKGRFNHAKQLIEEKSYNLCDAGYAIGFKNLTHFSRQFERFMGIKPISLKSKMGSLVFS